MGSLVWGPWLPGYLEVVPRYKSLVLGYLVGVPYLGGNLWYLGGCEVFRVVEVVEVTRVVEVVNVIMVVEVVRMVEVVYR